MCFEIWAGVTILLHKQLVGFCGQADEYSDFIETTVSLLSTVICQIVWQPGWHYQGCDVNRRIYHDVLELTEHSLDVNLVGNNIRYKFQDTPVLEGLTIHETYSSILVLVATVSSVHRLSFPHPDKIHKQVYIICRLATLTQQDLTFYSCWFC
jgi:hypothetical protein